MKNNSCPYLGLKDDPKTCLVFPDHRNTCHHVIKKAPPNLTYQEEVCLKPGQFKNCEVFKEKLPQTLPPQIVSSRFIRLQQQKKLRILIIITAVFFLLLVIIFGLRYFFDQKNTRNGSFEQQTNEASVNGDPLMSEENFSKLTLTPQTTFTGSCEVNPNWIPYTVKPTDSIFRISLLYNISVESILAANCLGDETYIAPHQVIYIPIIPSPTATITPTTTATQRIIVLPTATENLPKEATRLPPTATNIPLTATSPPPTATQVPPSPTTIPPTQTEIPTPTLPILPTQPNP